MTSIKNHVSHHQCHFIYAAVLSPIYQNPTHFPSYMIWVNQNLETRAMIDVIQRGSDRGSTGGMGWRVPKKTLDTPTIPTRTSPSDHIR